MYIIHCILLTLTDRYEPEYKNVSVAIRALTQ